MQFDNTSFLAYNKFNGNSQQGSFIFSNIKIIGLSMSTLHVFAFHEIMTPMLQNDGIYIFALIL